MEINTRDTSGSVISSEDVVGTKVYNPAGEKLGSIDTIMVDKYLGVVRYAVMEFGGFLGLGTDLYPLPWSALTYDPELGGYVVALTKAQLDEAPKYEPTKVPAYTDEYGRRVYDYYGVHWDSL